jgi:hypothetical protein
MSKRNWTPGRKAIAQMFAYAERWATWGAGSPQRNALAVKTKALIYQDRAA